MNKVTFRLQHIPPSTNNLYANVAGRGRIKSSDYRIWANATGWDLKALNLPKFTCPVYLTICIGKLPANADVTNRTKALEDLLVEHGIIPGDSRKWVYGVNTFMSPIQFDGVEVSITAADAVGEAA